MKNLPFHTSCLYKLYAQEGLSFLKNIDAQDFYFDNAKTTATVTYNATTSQYDIFFLEFEGFTCVYGF